VIVIGGIRSRVLRRKRIDLITNAPLAHGSVFLVGVPSPRRRRTARTR
jgi:hypothetical protein